MNRYPFLWKPISAGVPSTAIVAGKCSKKSMLNRDRAMFSGSENNRRTPPDARGVEASS